MLETFAALHRALTQIREHQKSVTLVGIGGYSALPVLRKGWYCYAFINEVLTWYQNIGTFDNTDTDNVERL